MSSDKSTAEIGLGCIGALIVTPFLFMLNGLVLSKLWAWFIVSRFPAIPPLNIPQAIGVAITVGMLTMKSYAKPKEDWYVLASGQVMGVLLTLGIGWAVKQFL